MYKLFVKDVANNDIYELPYNSIDFTHELNKGADARFNVDMLAVNEIGSKYNKDAFFILSAGKREIWVEKNNTKIYFGLISDLGIRKSTDAGLSIDIASVDLVTALSKRRTGVKRVFPNTDSGQIAWALVNESQTSDNPYSDLGITQGSIQTSVNRERTFRFANIYEEIWQMSNSNLLNGYDFEINNLKQFNVYYPTKGSQRANVILDDQNIIDWDYRKPLIMSLTNQVYVLGAGFNDDRVYVKRTASTTYRQTFGLLEDILSEPDTETTANLNDKGDRFLSNWQAPIIEIDVKHTDGEPDILNYDIGDSLNVVIPDLAIDGFMRVQKRNVQIDSNELAVVNLTLK